MNYCVWELISIEKSFLKEGVRLKKLRSVSSEFSDLNYSNSFDLKNEKVDYDYSEELPDSTIKKNLDTKLKFEQIKDKFFITDISKYVKAYVKKSDSNIREIGITSKKDMKTEEERYWINSYIYNFISQSLITYDHCKHYIVINKCENIIQELNGTGYGYYGIYFSDGKKIGGLGNLFINIKQVRHINTNIMKTLQTKLISDKSGSNNEEFCSFVNLL
ncbi:conserved protein, unknown function [Hepatocystis sp. ex Piliocolobus tephrosceles]|nr:conserved protein, unknown function [Hepatocystis sp. ex Piliocolobus tephrosceles]